MVTDASTCAGASSPLHPMLCWGYVSLVGTPSKGRVACSFAAGWHVGDFVLAPESFANRKQVMFEGLELLKRAWRGEAVRLRGVDGRVSEVRLFPLPVQRELPVWLTAVKNPETYAAAGSIGANVLTNLLGQTVEELGKNIHLYREARARHGHDPQGGRVTLLLHTFVGDELDAVREKVRTPFRKYLESAVDVIQDFMKSLGMPGAFEALSASDRDELLSFASERYYQTASLIGTPDMCLAMIDRLEGVSVNSELLHRLRRG